jgi:hypothetical protein
MAGRADLPTSIHGDSTHQKIGIGAGNASTTALIMALGGSLEIFPKEDLIGEGSQIFFEAVEMRWFSNPRKKFLPDRSDQPSAILTNQLAEDRCQPCIGLTQARLASPQGQRPNVGVDQDRQLRLPSSLRFVVVARIEIDGAEKGKNLEALALTNVFRKSRRDGLLLGLVMSDAPGLFDQFVIQG